MTLVQNGDAVSLKTISHYMQLIKSDQFEAYNYGSENNYQVYGQHKPFQYDLSRMKVRTILFRAENDVFAHKRVSNKIVEREEMISFKNSGS